MGIKFYVATHIDVAILTQLKHEMLFYELTYSANAMRESIINLLSHSFTVHTLQTQTLLHHHIKKLGDATVTKQTSPQIANEIRFMLLFEVCFYFLNHF